MKIHQKNVKILAGYRSQSTCMSDLTKNLNEFSCNTHLRRNNYVIFIGNMNINIMEEQIPESSLEHLNILNTSFSLDPTTLV